MDPAITFYQSLSGVSFTLLGIWFAVLQMGHGDWMDRHRHRSTLHIALHFFLPGLAGLVAVLAAGAADGLVWRFAFLLAGMVGLVEAVGFLLTPGGPRALSGRALRVLDVPAYLAVMAVTLVRPGEFALSPLQLAGLATGTVFTLGLCYVWLAFSERQQHEPAGTR
jgi:hypothetical protein